jgi:hypothetical protein
MLIPDLASQFDVSLPTSYGLPLIPKCGIDVSQAPQGNTLTVSIASLTRNL